MTGLDLAIVAVVGVSAALGIKRGGVRTLLSLVAWLAAFIAAKMLGPRIAPILSSSGVSEGSLLAAYVLVFIVALIGLWLTGRALRATFEAIGLGGIDSLAGGLLGATRGLVVVLAFTLAAGLTALPRADVWKGSSLMPAFVAVVQAMHPWLPETLVKYLRYS
jgi:membrane protein required for colicin V production